MARAYAKVLSALRIPVEAVGRSDEHAKRFAEETGVAAAGGGIGAWRRRYTPVPTHAVIAADVGETPRIAEELIELGVKRLLLEKPGALTKDELTPVIARAETAGAEVSIGYNRRFLASVKKAKDLIAEDGGVVSFYFEFNERTTQPERIKGMDTPEKTVARWFIANSTHVLDLAWHLGGEPHALSGFSAAGPLWAPHPTLFSGAGITKSGATFSYFANWEVDGPWLVELQTAKRKLVLNPLEKLYEEKDGALVSVPCDDVFDVKFRPGLYLETKSFLEDVPLPTLAEQCDRFAWYEKILTGSEAS
jgi:predicted dehydrogenase